MEVSDDEINETEWIERKTHASILRKYRHKTQRLLKEYQVKIQRQNQEIATLRKEVKRQQFIIDTFANETIEHLDNNLTTQKIPDEFMINENVYPKYDCEQEQEIDLECEPNTLTCFNSDEHVFVEQMIKVQKESLSSPHQSNQPKSNGFHRNENVPKKSSLVSIQIQPNIHDTDDVYVCDECNKIMSSRRVLVVC